MSNDFNDTYTPELINRLKNMSADDRVRISKALLEILK